MTQVTFTADTTPSLADLDANFTELYGKTAWAFTGIGYATGAGGTVTQLTSKSTSVTLDKLCGQITTHNASLASGATVAFAVANSLVAPTDAVIVNLRSASGGSSLLEYEIRAGNISSGSFFIAIKNNSGGSSAESIVINFAVIKGVTS